MFVSIVKCSTLLTSTSFDGEWLQQIGDSKNKYTKAQKVMIYKATLFPYMAPHASINQSIKIFFYYIVNTKKNGC